MSKSSPFKKKIRKDPGVIQKLKFANFGGSFSKASLRYRMPCILYAVLDRSTCLSFQPTDSIFPSSGNILHHTCHHSSNSPLPDLDKKL